MRKRFFILVIGACFLFGAYSAFAAPDFPGFFSTTYPGSGTASFGCSICHTSPPALNPYGTTLHSAGVTASSTQAQFSTAAHSIDNVDSDGDGFSNIAEINAGTNPGDPSSHPTPIPTPTPTPTPVSTMPCPTSEQVFLYSTVADPLASAVPATAKPIGIVVEAEDVDFQLSAAFDCPVDITLSAFAPGVDPNDIFFVDSNHDIKRFSEAIADEERANGCQMPSGSPDDIRKKFENLVLFMSDVTQVNFGLESLEAALPPGTYIITLGVSPTGSEGKTSYHWVTFFVVP